MSYTSRTTGPLTPEELDVKAVLADYSSIGVTSLDWVPFNVLWRCYLGWWGQYEYRRDRDHGQLTRQQFGRAVRRVFPAVKRSKRAVARKKRQWGYANLIGPLSILTRPPRRAAV